MARRQLLFSLALLLPCIVVASAADLDEDAERALPNDDVCSSEDSHDRADCSLKMLQRKSKQLMEMEAESDSGVRPKLPCLCLFDTDRTLTAIPEDEFNPPWDALDFPDIVSTTCPGAISQPLSRDSAYPVNFSGAPSMTLRIAPVTHHFRQTFCSKYCYKGILSVGSIGGLKVGGEDPFGGYKNMVETLEFEMNRGPNELRLPCSNRNKNLAGSGLECFIDAKASTHTEPKWLKPFIINIGAACYQKDPSLGKWSGACKVDYVKNITAYYKYHKQVDIPDDNVFFFDDACVNVAGFHGSNYHARQISCARRQCWNEPKNGSYLVDNNLGVCGATVDEMNAALTGPRHYLCTVDEHGQCDAGYGCRRKKAELEKMGKEKLRAQLESAEEGAIADEGR